MNKDQSRSVRR